MERNQNNNITLHTQADSLNESAFFLGETIMAPVHNEVARMKKQARIFLESARKRSKRGHFKVAALLESRAEHIYEDIREIDCLQTLSV